MAGPSRAGARISRGIFVVVGLWLLGSAVKIGWDALVGGELWLAGLVALTLGGGGLVFLLSATRVRADQSEAGIGVLLNFHMRAAALWIVVLMGYAAVTAIALALVEGDAIYLVMAVPALVLLVTRLLIFEVLGEEQRDAESRRRQR